MSKKGLLLNLANDILGKNVCFYPNHYLNILHLRILVHPRKKNFFHGLQFIYTDIKTISKIMKRSYLFIITHEILLFLSLKI